MRTTVLTVIAMAAAGCASAPQPAEEHMPGPASVYLSSDPAAPTAPIAVVMTSPDEPSIRFEHTFNAGQTLFGDFATSQGRYVLAALGGTCRLPIILAPNEVADVLLTVTPDTGCTLAVVRRRDMNDPTTRNADDAVLITNNDVGNKTPAIEPTPS